MSGGLSGTPSLTLAQANTRVESWVKVNMLALHSEIRHSAAEAPRYYGYRVLEWMER